MADPATPFEVEQEEDGGRFSAFHADLSAMYSSGIDRTRSAAEAVRNAAAAIGTIYAAVLGLIFSTDQPLPARGLIPAVFLGLAIVGSSAYLAYIRPWKALERLNFPPQVPAETIEELREAQELRTESFRRQTRKAINRRSYWLRVSVLALGFGVVFLPSAFIRHPDTHTMRVPQWPKPPVAANQAQLALYKAKLQLVASQRSGAGGTAAASSSSLDRYFGEHPLAWKACWGFSVGLALAFVFLFALPPETKRPKYWPKMWRRWQEERGRHLGRVGEEGDEEELAPF